MTTIDKTESTRIDANEKPLSTPINREQLYKLVWSEPMLKVAARFDVSSSYMARVCTRMNVPRPERGFWAKKSVGKAPDKPPLPEPQPGDELNWPWDSDEVANRRPLPRPPKTIRKRSKSLASMPGQHALIVGAKKHFETGRLSY